jgi:predicted dehydrogenase
VGKVDAVSIALPTLMHYNVSRLFLENVSHVLVEKPITTTVEEAEDLIRLAKANNLILQVGHLERFNSALQDLEEILGEPRFIESHRIAPFKLRGSDVNVILDLMIHDIELIQHLCDSEITHIDAQGIPVISNQVDIANARVHFANGCVANVTASRVSQKQERKMRLFQRDRYISINFQDKSVTTAWKGEGEAFPGVPNIETSTRVFAQQDQLQMEINSFVKSVREGTKPVVSGEDGKNALLTALKITKMITEGNAL